MIHINRYIRNKLLKALDVSPVVFLNGPRQAGKSTLVQGLNSRVKCDNLNFWEQNKGLSRCQNTTILQKEKEIDYMPIYKWGKL